MSDLIYQFSQQVPKDTLTNIGAGISGIVQQKQAAETLRLNQSSYDQLLQSYMDNPNEQTLMNLNQAAIPLGLTDETTAAVGQVQQIRADRAAAELHAEQMATYNDAMNAFKVNKSNENLMAWLDAGAPLGRFQEILDIVDKLTERDMQREVEEAVTILGPLRIGNMEAAAAEADLYAESYSNAGDPESLATAKGYREMAQQIRNGNGADVDTMLSFEIGILGKPGETAIKNLNTFEGEKRAETELALDIFQKGAVLKLHPSDLISARNAADMDPEWGELYNTVLDYATVLREAPEEGPSFSEVSGLMLDLADRFFKRTEGLRAAGLAVDDIQSAYDRTIGSDGGEATGTWTDPDTGEEWSSIGLDDLALINKFQRMIDPATVRKDDFDNIIGTESAAGRIRVWMNNLVGGVKLSPAQRAEIVALSRAFHEAQLKAVDDDVVPALEAARTEFNDLFGEGRISYVSVFGDYIHPEVRAKEAAELEEWKQGVISNLPANIREAAEFEMSTMTREEIEAPGAFGAYINGTVAAVPADPTGGQLADFKAFLVGRIANVTLADLDGMTLEQLAAANQGSWTAFNEQSTAPDNAGDYQEIGLDD